MMFMMQVSDRAAIDTSMRRTFIFHETALLPQNPGAFLNQGLLGLPLIHLQQDRNLLPEGIDARQLLSSIPHPCKDR